MNIEEKIMEKVKEGINKYNMLDKSQLVPIAFSGGKDSATTLFILSKLGFNVKAVIVDKGDDILFNSQIIAEDLKKYGYEAEILILSNVKYLNGINQNAANKIRKNLLKLQEIESGVSNCTPCYNARTIGLTEFTEENDASAFVIGQHKTDLITSMLKCYWTEQYYLKLTEPKGIAYNGNIMKKFIEENQIDLKYLTKMIEEGRAASDDPPVEIINDQVKLVRPLFSVSENEIKEFIGDYPHDSANCSYREREPRPFRLLVQWDLVKRLKENNDLEEKLYELAVFNLKEDGTLKVRPRNKREEYYPGFKKFIKKS